MSVQKSDQSRPNSRCLLGWFRSLLSNVKLLLIVWALTFSFVRLFGNFLSGNPGDHNACSLRHKSKISLHKGETFATQPKKNTAQLKGMRTASPAKGLVTQRVKTSHRRAPCNRQTKTVGQLFGPPSWPPRIEPQSKRGDPGPQKILKAIVVVVVVGQIRPNGSGVKLPSLNGFVGGQRFQHKAAFGINTSSN